MALTAQQKAARSLRIAKFNRERVRYKIVLQWRNPNGLPAGKDPRNWKNWRIFAAIPILFYSEEEAENYMKMVDIFKNIREVYRKPSASITKVMLPLKS